MSGRLVVRKFALMSAATVLSAAGMMVVQAPVAQAEGKCKQWFFADGNHTIYLETQAVPFAPSGEFTLTHYQGVRSTIQYDGIIHTSTTEAEGKMTGYLAPGSPAALNMEWRSDFTGDVLFFSGSVFDTGIAQGTVNGAASGKWIMLPEMICFEREPDPAAAPAPAAPAVPAAPDAAPDAAPAGQASITGDVDLYDAPGGDGNVIGMLTAGQAVTVAQCRDDNWCEIAGSGWVWGDFVSQ